MPMPPSLAAASISKRSPRTSPLLSTAQKLATRNGEDESQGSVREDAAVAALGVEEDKRGSEGYDQERRIIECPGSAGGAVLLDGDRPGHRRRGAIAARWIHRDEHLARVTQRHRWADR